MQEDQKLEFLKDEYFKLQDQYEEYDRRALVIKGWISAGSITAIAIGLDPEKSGQGAIWWAIAGMALCFWYLETKWKMFQYALRDRIRLIEAYFRKDPDVLVKDLNPLQIYSSWFKSYRDDEPIYAYEKEKNIRPKKYFLRFFTAGFQAFVLLPYALIIAICAIFLFT